MSRVLITGSTDGLGLMAGRLLAGQGHAVTLHARNDSRAADARAALPEAEGVVVGDLTSSRACVGGRAGQRIGRFDAVIHNAASATGSAEGRDRRRAVARLRDQRAGAVSADRAMRRPDRLVYLSSGMHHGGNPDLSDLQWRPRRWSGSQAYSDSKLFDAILAVAVARRWPTCCRTRSTPAGCPPGWAAPGAPATCPGGRSPRPGSPSRTTRPPGAPAATSSTSAPSATHPAVHDETAQKGLLAACADLSGVPLPA